MSPGRRRSPAGVDGPAELVGRTYAVLHQLAESPASERPERDRHLQGVGAPGGADRAAQQVREPCLGVVVGVEVVGAQRQRREHPGVRDGEHSGGNRLPAEFVQVERYGSGVLQAREERGEPLAEQQRTTVGGIDVESGRVPLGDAGDLR